MSSEAGDTLLEAALTALESAHHQAHNQSQTASDNGQPLAAAWGAVEAALSAITIGGSSATPEELQRL
eukprot:scaffold85399_cov42-Prasinocladus_malaysianus.AAC.1